MHRGWSAGLVDAGCGSEFFFSCMEGLLSIYIASLSMGGLEPKVSRSGVLEVFPSVQRLEGLDALPPCVDRECPSGCSNRAPSLQLPCSDMTLSPLPTGSEPQPAPAKPWIIHQEWKRLCSFPVCHTY